MKKRVSILLLCLLVFYEPSEGKFFQLGPRIGINGSNIRLTSLKNQFSLTMYTGYQAGLFARWQLPIFYIQPELLITHSGAQYKFQNQDEKLRYIKLELPTILGSCFFGIVRIQIGPVFSLLMNAKAGNKDIKAKYEPLNLGYQVGIGADIWRLIIDMKYAGALTPFGHELAGISTEYKPSSWILSIGYNIL